MDIGTLIDICNKFPDVRIKAIKDEQLTEHYNTGYGSWRWEYAEPALFFNGDGYMTLEDLIPYLDRLASGDLSCLLKAYLEFSLVVPFRQLAYLPT